MEDVARLISSVGKIRYSDVSSTFVQGCQWDEFLRMLKLNKNEELPRDEISRQASLRSVGKRMSYDVKEKDAQVAYQACSSASICRNRVAAASVNRARVQDATDKQLKCIEDGGSGLEMLADLEDSAAIAMLSRQYALGNPQQQLALTLPGHLDPSYGSSRGLANPPMRRPLALAAPPLLPALEDMDAKERLEALQARAMEGSDDVMGIVEVDMSTSMKKAPMKMASMKRAPATPLSPPKARAPKMAKAMKRK
eukprot:g14602.t1